MKTPAPLTEDAYGFTWGALSVTRILSHKGGVLLALQTKRGKVDVWVTRNGKIRIVRTGGFVTSDKRNER